MSNTAGVLQEEGTAYPSRAPEITPGFFLAGVRYDFRIKTMFGSSFPPVVYSRVHALFTLFAIVCI